MQIQKEWDWFAVQLWYTAWNIFIIDLPVFILISVLITIVMNENYSYGIALCGSATDQW